MMAFSLQQTAGWTLADHAWNSELPNEGARNPPRASRKKKSWVEAAAHHQNWWAHKTASLRSRRVAEILLQSHCRIFRSTHTQMWINGSACRLAVRTAMPLLTPLLIVWHENGSNGDVFTLPE